MPKNYDEDEVQSGVEYLKTSTGVYSFTELKQPRTIKPIKIEGFVRAKTKVGLARRKAARPKS